MLRNKLTRLHGAYQSHRMLVMMWLTAMLLVIPTGRTFAQSTPHLTLSLNISDIFTYAQLVVDALIPIVLITAGFGLGFFVLKVIANAFKSLG